VQAEPSSRGVRRGRLGLEVGGDPSTDRREWVELLLHVADVEIEHIVTGVLDRPIDYLEDHDEWVVVLHGNAVLEVGGERWDMRSSDWVFLAAGTAHRLVSAAPGTRWLAVHRGRAPVGEPSS
jgi:cupin 2 domain-containing protein